MSYNNEMHLVCNICFPKRNEKKFFFGERNEFGDPVSVSIGGYSGSWRLHHQYYHTVYFQDKMTEFFEAHRHEDLPEYQEQFGLQNFRLEYEITDESNKVWEAIQEKKKAHSEEYRDQVRAEYWGDNSPPIEPPQLPKNPLMGPMTEEEFLEAQMEAAKEITTELPKLEVVRDEDGEATHLRKERPEGWTGKGI